MSKGPQKGKSEDLAGLGSILSNMAERQNAQKTRDKMSAINKRSLQNHWERERSNNQAQQPMREKQDSDYGLTKGSDRNTELSDNMVRPSDHMNRPSDHTHEQTGEQTVEKTYPEESIEQSLEGYKVKTKRSFLDVLAKTDLRKKLLRHLLEEGNQVTSYRNILNELGVKTISARRALEHFEKHGIIQKNVIRSAQVQGLRINLLLTEKEKTKLLRDLDGSNEGADPRTDRGADHSIPPFLDRKIEKDLSVLETLRSWTEEQMAEWFPTLHAARFRRNNLQQVVDTLTSRGKPLDLVQESLEHAEWALAQGMMKDGEGKPIKSPANYLYRCLTSQNFSYPRPKGYVDPLEEALKERKERLAEMEKKKLALEEKSFQIWKDSLSAERLESIEKEWQTQKEEGRIAGKLVLPKELYLKDLWVKETEKEGIEGN